MNTDVILSETHLPDTLEDLTQFVLVGKAKLNAYMIKLQTVNKLSTAQEIRDQTLKEAQEVSTALIAAEQRIGELLLSIPKATPNNNKFHENRNESKFAKPKSEVVSEMGYTKDDVSDYQQMAKNPEVVQKVIDNALANGDVVTKTSVMREIKAYKDEMKRKDAEIQALKNQKPEVITKIKEVIPADYKQAKNKALSYDAETRRLNNKLQEVYEERNKILDELKEMQKQTVREQMKDDLLAGVIYFITQCGSFIRDVAGYVWIADKLADIPEKEREGYVKAASAVRDWSVALLQSIERDEEYGKSELQKLNEKSNAERIDNF